MEHSKNEQAPKTILRQTEVLRRTGLSRSTLYLRIGNGGFPRQVLLGARAVGWVAEEVDAWIADRMRNRPRSEQDWRAGEDVKASMLENGSSRVAFQPKKEIAERPEQRIGSRVSRRISMPDLAQLELIGANVYVEKGTGAIWSQLLRLNPPMAI